MEKEESDRASGQHYLTSSKTYIRVRDSLSKFAHDTKPREVVGMLESRVTFQKALGKPEEWK